MKPDVGVMESALTQLGRMSVIVADTGDIRAIERVRPRDATTNPSLLASAVQMFEYRDVVDGVLADVGQRIHGDIESKVTEAIEQLSVEFGVRILKLIPGRVSTELDPRLASDAVGTVSAARRLVARYARSGVERERILVKIPATFDGIRAAKQLEREGIRCNLTLIFGVHQAAASGEAGATVISPFVGRILDWHKSKSGEALWPVDRDPGVRTVEQIYHYSKKRGFATEIMAASFRSVDEVLALAGCDLLTVAPGLLDALAVRYERVERRLCPDQASTRGSEVIPIDHASFLRQMQGDAMATELLDQGVRGFTKAVIALEALVTQRMTLRDCADKRLGADGAHFAAYDFDGDGAITREEWGGLDAVFDAVDSDGDGRVTAAELAAALGCAHCLPRQSVVR